MSNTQDQITLDRIKSLQKHLAEENPLLVSVVEKFVELDKVGLGGQVEFYQSVRGSDGTKNRESSG